MKNVNVTSFLCENKDNKRLDRYHKYLIKHSFKRNSIKDGESFISYVWSMNYDSYLKYLNVTGKKTFPMFAKIHRGLQSNLWLIFN